MGESSVFLPERGRQIFPSVFFLGGVREGGREVVAAAGLSTGELCYNRSEQKCRQIKLKSVWGCSPLLLNYKIGKNNITGHHPAIAARHRLPKNSKSIGTAG